MAPKSKKAPSKKKMTKAERLRLMQEEEERRLKEEEEARLKFEKEEQERLEIQRIEREKWSLLEKKDLERRSQELEELALLEGCFPEAEKQKREIRALAQWKHYTECDGSPDPWVAQEMNTFISLWEEEKNQAFEQVMEKSKLVLSLIEKVKLILLETPTYELDHRTVLQHQGSILRLQELLSLKINVATELLLRQASNLADLDTGNMEKIIKDENVTLYVWANLKKNPRHRSVRFSETQIGFEIPRILATSNVALRLLHTRYDHITPLFPIAVTEQNQNPVGAEQVNVEESTEKAMTEEKLFTEEKAANEDEQPKAEQERELNLVQEENKYEAIENTVLQRTSDSEGEDSQTTQLELEMKLLSEAVLAGKFWRSDGISSVYYNREDRLLTFSMDTLGPVTLIQDAHVNMPYQSWEMSPCGMNKVLLIVKTVFMELQIYIKENLCMLASVKLRGKGLEFHLKGKWMAPIPFILALKEAGLNIFPAVYSHFYVVINNKVPQVELKAYRQMALLSSAFSFGWSKWNMVCNSTRVVIRVREQLSEETEHHTWSLLMFSGDRAQMLKMQEENDKFSEALREGTEFHSTLYHMMKDFASPVAMERVRHSNCQFIDSVCYMLLSIRVLSYS
ncbi:dynein axonemal intermediate chain 7 isoform X8 [Mus musculus]|uniref:dynein axonemal intermediate chain 7 isoform X8 n=1 Tax=Mus musculus TaxID=10090 RepID=UPI0003D734D8|nr:dynein axonemal intermediate chain 7 isoform X8 [Mus musculus]|eukprot:XP_006507037.1 PREDICTED: protein CASC1 isoform X8 [Mus musculus]